MITCIAKLKDGYKIVDAAREVWEVFGVGGNVEADHIEEFVGGVNSPLLGGYFRATFDEEYIAYLEGIKEIDAAESVEVISVEVDGQQEFLVDGEPLGRIAGITVSCADQ